MPDYRIGTWWVQDASSALPARILDVRPGERVLDMCAAPGGKTIQLAAAGADVTAIDISADRMKRVSENLARTRLSARLVVSDALIWTADAAFDAVLLDAPCSSTGTIRRHPDIPYVRNGSGLADLLNVQARLIDRAVMLLRPGGAWSTAHVRCFLKRERFRSNGHSTGIAISKSTLRRSGRLVRRYPTGSSRRDCVFVLTAGWNWVGWTASLSGHCKRLRCLGFGNDREPPGWYGLRQHSINDGSIG